MKKLYLMKLSNAKEEFYKVRKSGNLKDRVKTLSKYYNVELLWNSSPYILRGIDNIELYFHKDFKGRKYTPLQKFGG